jgi:hypothetical protein
VIVAQQQASAQIAGKSARVRDGQGKFEVPSCNGVPNGIPDEISGGVHSLMAIDGNRVVFEDEQARSSGHVDEGGVEHRLFLRQEKSCF